jgi:chromosome segregation ATPase
MKQILFTLTILSLVSCGKNEPLTQLGGMVERFPQDALAMGEELGQAPRKIGHELLGINPDKDKKKMNDLQDQLDDLESQLNDLRQLVNSNYVSTILELNKLTSSINQIEDDLTNVNSDIQAISDDLDLLLSKVDMNDIKDLVDFNQALSEANAKIKCASKANSVPSITNCLK